VRNNNQKNDHLIDEQLVRIRFLITKQSSSPSRLFNDSKKLIAYNK